MKKLFKILAVLLLAFSVIGCTKKDPEPTPTPETDPVEITIWHTFTDAQNEALTKIAADFTALNPGIKVTVMQQEYSGFQDKVINAAADGTGPNMIVHYSTLAASLGQEGLLIDFKPLIEADGGMDAFKATVTAGAYEDATQFDGGTKMYVYPMNLTATLLFYNKTMYDELGIAEPKTWDDITEAAKKVHDAKGISGLAFDSNVDNMILWLNQKGITYIDATTKTVGFNTPEVAELVDWYATGVKDGYFSIKSTGNYNSEDIGAGIVAAYIGSCAGVSYVDAAVAGKFEWAMTMVPQFDAENPVTTAFTRGVLGFTKDEAQDKAVYEFLKYWTSPAVHAYWCAQFNALSPYIAVAEEAEYKAYLEGNAGMALAAEGINSGMAAASLPGSDTVRTEFAKALEQTATDLATAQDALNAAETACNTALAGE